MSWINKHNEKHFACFFYSFVAHNGKPKSCFDISIEIEFIKVLFLSVYYKEESLMLENSLAYCNAFNVGFRSRENCDVDK